MAQPLSLRRKNVVTEMSNQNKFEHCHALRQVAEIRNLQYAFMSIDKASEIWTAKQKRPQQPQGAMKTCPLLEMALSSK